MTTKITMSDAATDQKTALVFKSNIEFLNDKKKRFNFLCRLKYGGLYKDITDLYKNLKSQSINKESSYTFVSDMVDYISANELNGLDTYITNLLETHCKNNFQAYVELCLSCACMVNSFNFTQSQNISGIDFTEAIEFYKDWCNKLWFDEDICTKYVAKYDMTIFRRKTKNLYDRLTTK